MKKLQYVGFIVLFMLAVVFVFSSCNKISSTNKFEKLRPDIDNEIFVILAQKSGGYENLVVTDVNKKIIYSNAEIKNSQILVFPAGSYYFEAKGINKSALLEIKKDCKVVYEGKTFKIQNLKEPTPVLFMNSRKEPVNSDNLVHGASYYLSILNMKDLDYASEYTATAKLKDNPDKNYTFKANISKNRLISENANSFNWNTERGTVTIFVDKKSDVIKPISFRVREPEPFEMTIKNTWKNNNKPIEWAEFYYFRLNNKDEEKIFKVEKMNDMEFKNKKSKYKDGKGNTNTDGKIVTTKDIRENDIIVIAISVPANSGIDKEFTWYIKTIEAREANKDKEELIWEIPAKSEERLFTIPVDTKFTKEWENVDERKLKAKIYYNAGESDNITSKYKVRQNLNDYTIVDSGRSVIQGDNILCWFDLSKLCAATRINFLIQVDTTEGVFIMDHTSYEVNPTHDALSLEK